MANPQSTFGSLLYISTVYAYCYHSVNVISLVVAKSDHIKHILNVFRWRSTPGRVQPEQDDQPAIPNDVRLLLPCKLQSAQSDQQQLLFRLRVGKRFRLQSDRLL
jgi:hypothetical protein